MTTDKEEGPNIKGIEDFAIEQDAADSRLSGDYGVHVSISDGDRPEEQGCKVFGPEKGDGSWATRQPVPPEDQIPLRTWVSYVKKDGAWVKEA